MQSADWTPQKKGALNLNQALRNHKTETKRIFKMTGKGVWTRGRKFNTAAVGFGAVSDNEITTFLSFFFLSEC